MMAADEISITRWEWQPIETAPKDGTEILVFVPKFDAPYWWCLDPIADRYPAHSGILVARFYDAEWVSPAGESGWEDSIVPMGITPTHWMPLPEPPK